MDFKKLEDRFNVAFIEGISKGLADSGTGKADEFRRSCYSLLFNAVDAGRVGPDFSDLTDMAYCRILAVAGFLKERGNKMAPVDYIPTKKAIQLIYDCG